MDTLQVTVINKCSYPVRIATGFEEVTHRGIYTVLKPLEHRANLSVSKLAYQHLLLNPKVSLTVNIDE
jgi:hypothetical protein